MRQYALRDRLITLGWDESLVKVIDSDLGISGKSAENREGFQRLVADVANGLVGAVACIEASRLSRNSSDWSRLIEFCSMTDTLLIDSDGVYSPNDFNDRMLLGLKGTMSEAELHFIQERMRGGLLNKARRGDLCRFLPIGYEYDLDERVVKTPNLEIRQAVEFLFQQFRIMKSAGALVTYYRKHNLMFPLRMRQRQYHQQVVWQPLNTSRIVSILHNPFYTGAYIFGRTQLQWVNGKRRPVEMPVEKWHANIPDHHEAYISKEEFEENQAILLQNRSTFEKNGGPTAPREGSTLLQGICYCGHCGYQMYTTYAYQFKNAKMKARYSCGTKNEYVTCHNSVIAAPVDEAISALIKEQLSPMAMGITLDVQQEIKNRVEERNRYYALKVENARYETERARMQYMSVDPSNRLVATELEKNWNQKLRLQEEAEQRYQEEISKGIESDEQRLTDAIKNITENFDTVWNSDVISNEDKKRIVRYVIRDVTITRVEDYMVRLDVVFQGGATTTLYTEAPKARYMLIKTPDDVLEFLEREAESHNYRELTQMLNEQGYKRECGRPFTTKNVNRIMKDYHIKTMKDRYLEKGWITLPEVAKRLGITPAALKYRIRVGKYKGKYVQVEYRSTFLFDPSIMPPAD
jgi:DNA invertase Pin-like site-specific DNA recombinase